MAEPIDQKSSTSQLLEVYGDAKRIAAVFYWFIALILAGLTAGIVILLSSGHASAALVVAAGDVPVLASIFFIRHQKYETAALFLAMFLIVLVTVLATTGLGVHHISILGYPAILIIASLVVQKRTMAFLTIFNIVCVAWLVFGELSGAFTPTVLVRSVPGDFYSVSIILILTAVMVRLISETLFQSNRRLQKELKERQLAEEKYRAIIDNALDGIFQSTPEGNFISVNPAMARMYGFETPEQMLKEISDISNQVYFDSSHRAILREQLESHGSVQGFEMQDRKKDGTIFWSSMNVRVVYDEKGNVRYYEGTQEDITKRKEMEENLRQREAILSAVTVFAELVFKTPDWGTEIDHLLEMLGKAIDASHAYLFEHFEGPEGELLGSMRAEWTAPHLESDLDNSFYQNLPVLEPGLERWCQLLDNEQPFLGDRLNATPDELVILKERGLKAVLDMPITVEGKWWGVIGFDDVTAERLWTKTEVDVLKVASNVLGAAIQRQLADETIKAELDQRKRLVEELEVKNEELERFTYTVSHDLKAPLVTINGFLGYLEEDATSGTMDRLKSDIQRIQDATKIMQRLLNDLLELSRIGRLMNPSEKIPFAELAQDALDLVYGRLEERNITVELDPNLPIIYGDRQRLTEVLQNLIDNAAKFMGDQSNPCIEIGQRGEEDGKPVLFVRDNGIGIAPEYHEKVFGLFNKLDPKIEGTGVGLALVKRVVEFHGGRIWVESEAGKGSMFCFTLGKNI